MLLDVLDALEVLFERQGGIVPYKHLHDGRSLVDLHLGHLHEAGASHTAIERSKKTDNLVLQPFFLLDMLPLLKL